jgi:hypothetical protein
MAKIVFWAANLHFKKNKKNGMFVVLGISRSPCHPMLFLEVCDDELHDVTEGDCQD